MLFCHTIGTVKCLIVCSSSKSSYRFLISMGCSRSSASSPNLGNEKKHWKALKMKHHSGNSKITTFGGSSGTNPSRSKVYIDSEDGLIPTSTLPSPMNTARMDINTLIITIPASSLDCPILVGKGLSLVSPVNSARNSPANSSRIHSRRNSQYDSPAGSPTTTPPASRRNSQMLMNNERKNGMPTIHSALNFADMFTYEEDDYSVGYSLCPEPTRHSS